MEAIINEEKEMAKNKLMKVFKYLQSLNQIRNPVKRSITEQLWTLWLHDFPDHETITFQNGIDNESDIFIVKVRRPEITKCPPPPSEIKEWLDSGWEKPENMVSFQTEKELMDEEGEPILIQFDEDDERVRLSEQWMKKRTEWAKLEIPAKATMRIYERLYDLYARIEREYEQVELLVGDGILTWRTYNIFHPVLLRKVQLDFDPNIPEFTIRETEQTSEFYTSLFREIDEVHPQAVRRILDDLENGHWEPLDDLETTEFFKRLVSQISSNGKYVEDDENLMDRTIPYIKRDPVFFLRRRSLGFTRTLEAILEDLPQREEVPEAVSRIVGIHPKKEVESEEFSFVNLDVNGEDEHILLSKEANQEQLKIALQLKKYGSVLVQGPPGTGKTHTIANLIGYLLSEEKKVLVTSHTAKALSVLREKVVEPLQSLCVSVLDHDSSKEQLANSIDEINERLSLIDIEVLQKEVDKIEADRKKIIKKLKELRHQLTQTRLNEYRPIVFAGQEYDPSKAARKIANSSEDGWIPGPVKLGEPLPLSIEELQLLYETNEKLTKLEEVELRMPLPKTSDLMPPDQYQEIISEQHQLQMKSVNDQKELWNSDNQSMETLRKVLMSLEKAKNLLKEDGWAYSLFDAGKEENKKKVWLEFFNEIEEVYQLSLKANSSFIKYGPQLPENMELNEIVQTLEQILTYLKQKQNKKIGSLQLLLKKDWKQLINQSKVDGNKPESIEHFEALYQQVQLKIARNKLVNRWDRQVTSINGPDSKSLGNEPEELARQHVIEMKKRLEWFSQDWKKLTIDMNSIGFKWETILSKTPKKVHVHGDIIQLKEGIDSAIQLIQSRINKLKYNQNQKSISILKEKLEKSLEASPDSMVTKGLLHAVASENVKDYRNHYERLRTLELKTEIYQLRTKLLTKLKSFAPAWAESIKERVEIHGSGKIPGDVEKAWIFRQLYDELELRGSTSIEGLQTEITQLSNQLRIITTTLIEKKAWLGQAKRTTNTERQALAGWKALMKKVGKGTGKRAPYLLAEARKQMAVAQSAVPVWIMPISRVVESFNPKENQFDVVIIDEASQSDVMALTALYYGKQVVVVGDDEQVSPDAVGQKLEVTQQLIDTMLDGIPNKQLYDGQTSVYDLAKTSFEGMVQLREHFRCVEPIIQFSNHLSYKGEIEPLRDESEVKIKPPTIAYRVEGFSDDKVNEVEAIHLVSLLLAASEQKEYEGATFGVISLIGEEQALKIDTLLRKYISPVEYKKRKIRVGNSSQFQGDERDVIFLSMVHGPSGDGPIRRLSDPNERMKKRFNVAVSRARDQVWLIHSLDPEQDLKDGDIRKRLIKHMQDPNAVVTTLEKQEKKAESEFERLVIRRLISAGYQVKPQWKVGSFRIDIVVEGGGKRLAIECDGDRWHPLEKLEEDMNRQAILERLGWKFVRIRGSAFFRDPDKAMIPVFEKLKELEIPPEGFDHSEMDHSHYGEELKNRIIRRAAEIRYEWEHQDEEEIHSLSKKGSSTVPSQQEERRDQKEEPIQESFLKVATEERRDQKEEPIQESFLKVATNEMILTEPQIISVKEVHRNTQQLELNLDSNKENNFTEGKIDHINFQLVTFLEKQGLEVIDKRDEDGSLWVIGNKEELTPLMTDLKEKGVRFLFSKTGSSVTKNRSAWYTSYKY